MLTLLACFSSCKKDSTLTLSEIIVGTWDVVGIEVDGVPADPATYNGIKYTFENCSTNCVGISINTTNGQVLQNFHYEISSDETQLRLYPLTNGVPASMANIFEVDEHSQRTLNVSIDKGGTVTSTAMSKQ